MDVIIGGDSHTLLGDFKALGLPSGGRYPTVGRNAAGLPDGQGRLPTQQAR